MPGLGAGVFACGMSGCFLIHGGDSDARSSSVADAGTGTGAGGRQADDAQVQQAGSGGDGLLHACEDGDHDGYGVHCMRGSDCDDSDPAVALSCADCVDRSYCVACSASAECKLDAVFGEPVQPLSDVQPQRRHDLEVAPAPGCALGLRDEEWGLQPVGTLEVDYVDYCRADLQSWDALGFTAWLPPGTSIEVDVCGADAPERDCDWQPLLLAEGGERCRSEADCGIHERCVPTPSGTDTCLSLLTNACMDDDECGAGGLCHQGRCARFEQPLPVGRYIAGNLRSVWRIRATLRANDALTSGPLLEDLYLTYWCNCSV